MATTTIAVLSTPGFVVDPASVVRSSGRQIKWADVDVARKNSAGKKVIPAGMVVVERAGQVIPRADRGVGEETAFGILETAAVEDEAQAALTGYGVIRGGIFYENLLPDVLDATIKGELSVRFAFEDFEDSRLD